ncbi:MAG: hypothetical protein WEB85_10430 [Dongiaceae bacterium]
MPITFTGNTRVELSDKERETILDEICSLLKETAEPRRSEARARVRDIIERCRRDAAPKIADSRARLGELSDKAEALARMIDMAIPHGHFGLGAASFTFEDDPARRDDNERAELEAAWLTVASNLRSLAQRTRERVGKWNHVTGRTNVGAWAEGTQLQFIAGECLRLLVDFGGTPSESRSGSLHKIAVEVRLLATGSNADMIDAVSQAVAAWRQQG